jgi:hypothetical protein
VPLDLRSAVVAVIMNGDRAELVRPRGVRT